MSCRVFTGDNSPSILVVVKEIMYARRSIEEIDGFYQRVKKAVDGDALCLEIYQKRIESYKKCLEALKRDEAHKCSICWIDIPKCDLFARWLF